MSPWELEGRPDSLYWVNEAITMKQAESEGEKIAEDLAEKKRKRGKTG